MPHSVTTNNVPPFGSTPKALSSRAKFTPQTVSSKIIALDTIAAGNAIGSMPQNTLLKGL